MGQMETSNFKWRIKKNRIGFTIICLILLLSIVVPTNCQAASNGTEKNPYVLSEGSTKNVTIKAGKTTWYKFTTTGEIKLSLKFNNSCDVTIYQKKLLGKSKINNWSSRKTISPSYSLYSKTTYLIAVKNKVKTNESLSYKYNVDSVASSYGGVWTENVKSANPDISLGLTMFKEVYIPAGCVPAYYTAMSNSTYLKTVERIATGVTTVATAYAGGKKLLTTVPKLGKFFRAWDTLSETAAAAGIIYVVKEYIVASGGSLSPFALTKFYCNDIKKITGYDGKSAKAPSKGMRVEIYRTNGTLVYHIYSWDGKTMKGRKGMKGSFKKLDTFTKFS